MANESYKGEPVEISPILTIDFPVDRLVDEFVSSVYGVSVDFENQTKQEIQKILYETNQIPTVDDPGLTTLVDTAIRMIIKIIGSFAQQIFLLTELISKIKDALLNPAKNADFLASIPDKLQKFLDEINSFFTDTVNWLMDKFLGALSNINIPIPEISFEIMGFKLTIPEIDNKGAFKDKEVKDGNGNVIETQKSPFKPPEKEKKELSDIQNKVKEQEQNVVDNKKNPNDDLNEINNELAPKSNSLKKEKDKKDEEIKEQKQVITKKEERIEELKNKDELEIEEQDELEKLENEKTKLEEELVKLNDQFKKIKEDFENVKKKLDEKTDQLANRINETASEAEKKLEELKSQLKDKLMNNPVSAFLQVIKDTIINIIKMPVDFLIGLFKQLLKAVTAVFSFDFSQFDKLIEMMKPSIDSVKKFIFSLIDSILNGFSTLYEKAKEEFGDVKENINDVIKYLKEKGNEILGKVDNEENREKLNNILKYFSIAINITEALPELFLNLIIELFNYALQPIGVTVG